MKSQGAAKNEANNAAQTATVAPAEAEKTVEKIDFSKVKVEPLFEERLISILSASLISVQ